MRRECASLADSRNDSHSLRFADSRFARPIFFSALAGSLFAARALGTRFKGDEDRHVVFACLVLIINFGTSREALF